jgi:hypothetical protein
VWWRHREKSKSALAHGASYAEAMDAQASDKTTVLANESGILSFGGGIP